jgi:hypothetical protein
MPVNEKLIIELQANVDKYKKEIASAGKVTETTQRNIETSLNKITQGIRKSGDGFKGFGRNAGQAGIQVQQFFGQIQGGQSVMLALSQQAADLGIVLGAAGLGATVGLLATGFSFLLPNLFSSTTAMQAMQEAADALDETLRSTKDGTKILADELLQLSGISENLAKVRIAKGIEDSEEAIKQAGIGINDTFDELPQQTRKFTDELALAFEETGGTAKEFSETLKDSLSVKGVPIGQVSDLRQVVRELSSQFNLSTEQAVQLGIALGNVKRDANPLTIKALSDTLGELNAQTNFSNSALVGFTDNITPFIQQTNDSVNTINALTVALANFSEAKEKTKSGEGLLPTSIAPDTESFEAGNQLFLEQSQEFNSFFLGLKQEQADAEAEINKRKLEKIVADDKEAEARRTQQAKQAAMARELIQLAGYRSIISGLSALNSAFLDENKALNAGLIIADTAAAAMSAYKIGGPPAAFAAIATGAAQLAANNSAQKGGGSIGGAGGGVSTQSQAEPEQPTIGVSVSDLSTGITEQRIIISTDDGRDIFDGISKGVEESRVNNRT